MTDRLNSGVRRLTGQLLLSAVVCAGVGSARAEVGLDGAEYALAGRPPGDQTHPSAAFGPTRGYLVWQDNATDGDGLGVSARRLDLSGSAVGGAFRVNEGGAGDQEAATVAILADGSTVFAWQSGLRGSRAVLARVLGPNGVFVTGDVVLSPAGTDNRNPTVAALSDGSAVVTWASTGADGDLLGVLAQRVGSPGDKLGDPIVVNQFTRFNQRNPVVAPLPAGGFAVAWISEQQTGENRTDVYLRRFGANGSAQGDEARVNPGIQPCANPSLVAVGSGGLAVAWSQLDTSQGGVTGDIFWSIQARWLDAAGTGGPLITVSDTLLGSQMQPRLAVSGDQVLAVWMGTGLDQQGTGVGGRLLSLTGVPAGGVLTLDSAGNGDQISPTVAALGAGRFLSVWSTWNGVDTGMDLAAQRLAPQAAVLTALDAPVVEGLSSWQVKASWAPLSGLNVKQYEVYLDGATTPEITTDSFWSSPDVLPGTTHSVQIDYLLTDGRRSPLSAAGQGRSWGKDTNGDGLPDDWQAQYFGPDPASWPGPGADSDGDGVSNRDEFLSGTNPADSNDVLKVVMEPTGQGLQLSWSSHPGGIYQLQTSNDLKSWTNSGGYRFAASTRDSVILRDAPASAYFRVNRIR